VNEGLQVLTVGAFYRDDEPGGIATGIQFGTDEGAAFCAMLESLLPAYDARANILQLVQDDLARLSARRERLSPAESAHVIMCIYWLQTRGHLVAGEYNGTMFVCLFNGAMLQVERNPVTMDLAVEMVGKNAVDVTDIIQASNPLDGGAVEAVKVVVEHARRR